MAGFKTLEEAQKGYDSLLASKKETDKKNSDLIKSLTKRAEDAELTAKDAIQKVNAAPVVNDNSVTIDKKKYRINFGVDGFTKEQLKDKPDLLAKLVKIGSGAITLID